MICFQRCMSLICIRWAPMIVITDVDVFWPVNSDVGCRQPVIKEGSGPFLDNKTANSMLLAEASQCIKCTKINDLIRYLSITNNNVRSINSLFKICTMMNTFTRRCFVLLFFSSSYYYYSLIIFLL